MNPNIRPTYSLCSPAKLNLFLHVVGRLPNGYHQLQTHFIFLDLMDELSFELLDDRKIVFDCDIAELNNDDNLVVKAAKVLQQIGLEQGQKNIGISIYLKKKIPFGGGLGGGSSDAATTLLALNKLWDLNLSSAELADIGLRLGADVPIFLLGRSAFAEGVGEQLTPLDYPETTYLLLIPPCSVNTVEIFCDQALTRDSEAIKLGDYSFQLEQLSGFGRNDLQEVVFRRQPIVSQAFDYLREFGEPFGKARMTGSGSTLFLPVGSPAAAEVVIAEIERKAPKQYQFIIAKGMNVSPTQWGVAKW